MNRKNLGKTRRVHLINLIDEWLVVNTVSSFISVSKTSSRSTPLQLSKSINAFRTVPIMAAGPFRDPRGCSAISAAENLRGG